MLQGLTSEPTWQDGQSKADFSKARAEFKQREARVFGHLEMLVNSGYIEGVIIRHGSTGFHYGVSRPRLTMAGHDLLDTRRSKPIWVKVKSLSRTKGLESKVDVVKESPEPALASVIAAHPHRARPRK